MFKISNQSTENWTKHGNIFCPHAIILNCAHCKNRLVTFTTNSWSIRQDSSLCETRCPACKKTVKFWLIPRQKQETQDNAIKVTDIFTEPDPPLHINYDQQAIDEISPDFSKIYRHACQAEQYGLSTLVGIGYRKALEFLLKDWAIKNNPDDRSKIEKMNLSKCISEYVKDLSLRDRFARAVWLGNDETHYKKIWEDKDLEVLKRILNSSLMRLADELENQRLKTTMPSPTGQLTEKEPDK